MGTIQGLDTIPRGVIKNSSLQALFTTYLPGWSITGEYNFQPGVSTQRGAAQLQVLMQSGNHKWINDAIADLLNDPEFKTLDAPDKTIRLSALVQFMSEASGPEAIASGGARTGRFIAFSSLSDPHLIAKLGYAPNGAQMAAITRQGISWGNILGSDAGKAVLALNPRIVEELVDGKTVKTLEYTGKTGTTGFFSRTQQEVATTPWTKPELR